MLEPLEQISSRLEAHVPGASLQVIKNPGGPGQDSILVSAAHAAAVAAFLKTDAALRLDYLSNVTGVDWPPRTLVEKKKTKQIIDGVEREIEATSRKEIPGYLEVVYHFYSVELKHGPVILRVRTVDRDQGVHLPSLTPVWRSAEFQEREVFDLYGVVFDGHPDLRRILMWDGFKDHPMRKDYVDPDDFEYEPTPHDTVLDRARERQKGASAA